MTEEKILDRSILNTFPTPDKETVKQHLQTAFREFQRKIVILDDDPTGTQTVHDVPVYTDWSTETLIDGLSSNYPMFFILTNSRSFTEELTKKVHKEIGENLSLAFQKTGQEFVLISRGDSTLRGHFPLETSILRETLEVQSKIIFDGEIICPFFPEGGRYTINNIHYVLEGDQLTPAGMTEFAADKSFGYKSSHLGDYLEEKSHGLYKSKDCIYISLKELCNCEYQKITQKLLDASGFSKIIVNAIDYTNLEVFMTCWLAAMKKGKHYIARSAAALVRIAGNISDVPLLTKQDLVKEPDTVGGLVMIGSHVKKTSEQLDALLTSSGKLYALEFLVKDCQPDTLLSEAERILSEAEIQLSSGKTVVIFTPRQLIIPNGATAEDALNLSVNISNAFTEIVRRLSIKPRFLLAKGGITSSDIATKGLSIKNAMVMGQLQKGIPVWLTGDQCKFPHMPYIIFPGNVGSQNTLRDIVKSLL